MATLDLLADRLTAALDALPDGGRPHVSSRGPTDAGGRVLHTVTGAAFTLEHTTGRPSIEDVAARLRPHLHALADEPWDLYALHLPDRLAALEIRAMAGVSWLVLDALVDGQRVRARVHQDDAARWEAEDDGSIGEDFKDFDERNAVWTALERPRPRGWTLTVVEPGDALPDVFSRG